MEAQNIKQDWPRRGFEISDEVLVLCDKDRSGLSLVLSRYVRNTWKGESAGLWMLFQVWRCGLLGEVPSRECECRAEAEAGQCVHTEPWKSSGLSVCRTLVTDASSQQHAWF